NFLQDSLIRLKGFQEGVQKFGLDADPDLIVHGNHSLPRGREVIEDVLRRGVQFSAVLASNDESAIGAIEALHQAGLMVPQDVAVIGFDDRFEAKAQVPVLTTIHHPMYEMGYQSAHLLIERIQGRVSPDTIVKIPTRLVIRESCGCQAGVRLVETPPEQPANDPEQLRVRLARQITAELDQELQELRLPELEYLSERIVDAFLQGLSRGSLDAFEQTLSQVLHRAAMLDDDLFIWQKVVSVLSEHLGETLNLYESNCSSRQIEDQFHRARLAISEAARSQFYRTTVERNERVDQIGRLTSRLFAARNEEHIFQTLAQDLPGVGIRHAAVAFYQPEGEDPCAISVLPQRAPFPTRAFPPKGLYETDKPFSLAILPLVSGKEEFGYIAFDAASMDYLALIAYQVLAAIQGVRLFQQAIDARQVAEEQRHLAEEANRSKSRFLSMVSHEIRTPLNLISGLSDMLLKESQQVGGDKVQIHKDDLERIYVASRHLDGLIQDVIELTSLDVGRLKLNMEPLDLSEVLQSVAVIGKQLARDKGLAWSAEFAGDLPRVLGDRTRLRQVTLNLVNNAVKFTAQGKVSLTAFTENNRITVAVNDTGLGIPVEEQETIFDDFSQSTRTSTRGYGGLGLGLAISRRLVELHGGVLDVCSSGEENLGSMFFYNLPVIPSTVETPALDQPGGKVQRVLILVKAEQDASLLHNYLQKQGFEAGLLAVDEGSDWLTELGGFHPDAVVLDGELTAERGWEILRIVKEKSGLADVPVLFFTLNESGNWGSFLEMDYMVKPIEAANLAEILMSLDLMKQSEDEDWEAKEKTVLVADDDPGIRNLHSRIVAAQSQRNRVLEAANGREALDLIRQERPDLVLLDLMMPEMDGFAVLEAMREDESSRNIPVVVVTGQRLTEEDMARLNAGVTHVLAKGVFTPDETLRALSETLQRKHRPGTESQRLVLKAMAFIHAHYPEGLSRADVAAHVGVSERHLSRCFQQEVGLTPMTYLNRFRVKVARALLDAGAMSITDVALEVGFSTGGYFTRVFRDEMGVSPRAYLQSRC
ncbi:MAG TPA: response regulator, partial [Anaerolinea sp.]|nr:response regulator [Anaerolinea sp.]